MVPGPGEYSLSWKGYLFIIEILHKFKKENKNIYYHFRGMINNSLLIYFLTFLSLFSYHLLLILEAPHIRNLYRL